VITGHFLRRSSGAAAANATATVMRWAFKVGGLPRRPGDGLRRTGKVGLAKGVPLVTAPNATHAPPWPLPPGNYSDLIGLNESHSESDGGYLFANECPPIKLIQQRLQAVDCTEDGVAGRLHVRPADQGRRRETATTRQVGAGDQPVRRTLV
jgi:hypothetical protein